ncbi:MAG: hypothetical protein V4508_06400 [Pseudomonadota bacterium]
MKRLTICLTLLCGLGAQAQNAPAPHALEDRPQLERRLASVATLIERSSAAQQIDSSANAEALAARAGARQLQLKAAEALRAGRLAEASGLLDQAAKELFAGVRLAAPEQVTGAKLQRDFDARMDSVKALLTAQKRISAEKGQGTAASAAIEQQVQGAQALAAGGKLEVGRVQLDQAYLRTRLSIESMRSGDTLVRSLQFASKEEEYRYEVDRNDTHKMLVTLLLAEKRAANPGLEGQVQKYLELAAAARGAADASAARQDWAGAIKLLEDGTRELVRAIRGAGVYIPG